MKHPRRNAKKTLDRVLSLHANPSQERMDFAIQRVWTHLSSQPVLEPVEDIPPSGSQPHQRPFNTLSLAVSVAAMVVVVVVSSIFVRDFMRTAAVVEAFDGNLYRTDAGAGIVLALRDTSRIEMRSESELLLEHANDGTRIRLNRGSIIVNAAKQRAGHLYVQTKDMTVSVLGTVFLVNTEEAGSRVAVIQGEVQVDQGTQERKLKPGEQVSTNPVMPSVPVIEELAWSRNAASHLALLQQSLALLQQPAVISLPAPPQSAGETREAFEVISIRPSAPLAVGRGGPLPAGCGGPPIQIDPRRFAASKVTLHRLIALAYGKHCRASLDIPLISGGPAWVRTDTYDIQAVIPEGSPTYTVQQLNDGEASKLQMMLQSMLSDRFGLMLHRDMKEVPVYNLVVVRAGRVKLSEDQTPPAPPESGVFVRVTPGVPLPRGRYALGVDPPAGKVTIGATAVPLSNLINVFQGQEGRLVIDKTDFKGLIDIPTQVLDVGPFDVSPYAVSVWPEIMLQLGLKLEPGRAPVEVLIIDRAEKPSEN